MSAGPGKDVHTIRLRGPWQFSTPQGGTRTVKLPAGWADVVGNEVCETLCCERVFHRPTIMAEYERVWLVVVGDVTEVALNRQRMEATLRRWEVTELLEETNRLALLVGAPSDHSAELLTVTLEIEERI